MKIIFFSFFLLATFFISTDSKSQSVSLSDYLFESVTTSKPLTSIISPAGNNYKISIAGKDASKLMLKENEIFVKEKFLKRISTKKEIHFSVLIKENNQLISKKSFTILKDNFHHNQVIAHRGAWKNTGASENSVASLKAAIALGCAGSETDVHMTEDSFLVINHDPVWGGLPVQKSTLAELRKTKLSNGEQLPLLEDFLKIIGRQNGSKLILEFKASEKGRDWANATVQKTLKMINEMELQPWMVYISFDYEILKEILRLEPSAKVQYLNGDKTPEQLKQDGITGADYHYSVFQKHPEWIESAKAIKITLNAWTVNDEKMMLWLLQNNFDFITTNEPELLFKLITK